jgi:uncharacterized protein YkwD
MSNIGPLLFVALLALPAAALGQTPLPSVAEAVPCRDQAFAREAEALIAQRINAERARLVPDAPALQTDPALTRIAQVRSCDMVRGQSPLSHTDEQGHFIAGDMVHDIFGPFGIVGENIMRMGAAVALGVRPFGPDEFARAAVEVWMSSPEHRANILNPRYDASGVGVAKVDGQAVATQVFRGPARVRGRDHS